MVRQKNIIKILAIALLASLPRALYSSDKSGNQTELSRVSAAADKDVAVQRQAALRGGPVDSSNLEKLFPGFVAYEFDLAWTFDPETDNDNGEILALHGDERSRKLNYYLQLSMDGTGEDIDTNKDLSTSEKVSMIIFGIRQARYDLHAMAYYGGKLDSETFDNLIDYFSDIPYGDLLPSEGKKVVAEAIISLIAKIPEAILNEGDRTRLNACCFQIWDELQNGTLWEGEESSFKDEDTSESEEDSEESDEANSEEAAAK